MELQYSVGDHPDYHEPDSRFNFPSKQGTYGGDWALVATDLAEDYHHGHDGWEASWPVTLKIWKDGECVREFEIEREAVPSFHVIKEKA